LSNRVPSLWEHHGKRLGTDFKNKKSWPGNRVGARVCQAIPRSGHRKSQGDDFGAVKIKNYFLLCRANATNWGFTVTATGWTTGMPEANRAKSSNLERLKILNISNPP
jgi:hypothetical protein